MFIESALFRIYSSISLCPLTNAQSNGSFKRYALLNQSSGTFIVSKSRFIPLKYLYIILSSGISARTNSLAALFSPFRISSLYSIIQLSIVIFPHLFLWKLFVSFSNNSTVQRIHPIRSTFSAPKGYHITRGNVFKDKFNYIIISYPAANRTFLSAFQSLRAVLLPWAGTACTCWQKAAHCHAGRSI